VSSAAELDRLARQMTEDARRLQAGSGRARVIVENHTGAMLEKARSVALGAPSSADLAKLRGELHRLGRSMAWELAGAGNTNSWAFGEVVKAIRAAEATSAPLLALAGVGVSPVDQEGLAAAFTRLDATFRKAAAGTAELVQREVVRMVTAGQTSKQMAGRLVASKLINPVSNLTPQAHAEVIARTETMRVYRQSMRSKAQTAGLVHYRMVGPVTATTSRICRSFVGRVMSAEDWKVVMGSRWDDGEHTNRGMHPNCRHSWQPVVPKWLEKRPGDYSRTDAFNSQAVREHDSDESLPKYSMEQLRAMPEPQRRELFKSSDVGIRLEAA